MQKKEKRNYKYESNYDQHSDYTDNDQHKKYDSYSGKKNKPDCECRVKYCWEILYSPAYRKKDWSFVDASSVFVDPKTMEGGTIGEAPCGLGILGSADGWCPAKRQNITDGPPSGSNWQMNFGTEVRLIGVATQRRNIDIFPQRVTKFQVTLWNYPGSPSIGTFDGNLENNNDIVKTYFNGLYKAKAMYIWPTAFVEYPSMRSAAILWVCEGDHPLPPNGYSPSSKY